jgi:hypothetical protein
MVALVVSLSLAAVSFARFMVERERERTDEKIAIDDVFFYEKSGLYYSKLNLSVYNYGPISVSISSVYVNGTLASTFAFSIDAYSQTWSPPVSGSWKSGNSYVIKVFTYGGAYDESVWKAP